MSQKTCSIGVVGLAVMGANLARNFASRNIPSAVFNRTYEKTRQLVKNHGNKYLIPAKDLKEFVNMLQKPRRILIMVQAGIAVDEVIGQLKPLLDQEDIIIDGGNSDYHDTIRRTRDLQKNGLHFVGIGISGGEEGALRGPSLMPGGSDHSWKTLAPLLKKIAAKDFDGNPCVTHIGTDGAGHFVKMVHNGIEYAVMQLMAETYDYLRKIHDLEADEIAKVFEHCYTGKLKSFLFEIILPVLRQKNDRGKGNLIDVILDKAGQKGTGAWTAIDALSRGIPLSSVSEAVFARSLSAEKNLRMELEKTFPNGGEKHSSKSAKKIDKKLNREIENALYLAITLCYAQGLHLITAAAQEQHWSINLSEVCRIWQGGCIIRSELLRTLAGIYKKNPHIKHLLLAKELTPIVKTNLPDLQKFALTAMQNNLPTPCTHATLNYFNGITSAQLSANLIQGLRDYFGAHTFERTDRPGIFHFNWNDQKKDQI